MSGNAPILVTRAHIGKGPGIVLVSFGAPAGDLGKGQVENVEVMRIALTHSSFKEIAALFSHTLGELGLSEAISAPIPANEPARLTSEHPMAEPPVKKHERGLAR